MSVDSPPQVALLDGDVPTSAELAPLAFAGFAHFTALQVRHGSARSVERHLGRLANASRELFDRRLDTSQVRDQMRRATELSAPQVSMTVTVYPTEGEFNADERGGLRVLVRTSAPSDGPGDAMRLATHRHERYLPTVKQVGEPAKTHLMWRARAAGYDDVAFVDRHGALSEATIWNLALWDGEQVVWPQAEKLDGIMQSTVRAGLEQLGVPQVERVVEPSAVGAYHAMALMNSWTPCVPVVRLDDVAVRQDADFTDLLRRAHDLAPLEPV